MEKVNLNQLIAMSIASRISSAGSTNDAKKTKKAILIQPKDIDVSKYNITHTLPVIDVAQSNSYLNENEIIISTKGVFKAFLITKELAEKNTVASSSFILMKLNTNLILPEYLVEFLNSAHCQAILKKSCLGATIPSINKSTLADIQIELPPVAKQIEVVKTLKEYKTLVNLRKQQLELTIQQHKAVENKLIEF